MPYTSKASGEFSTEDINERVNYVFNRERIMEDRRELSSLLKKFDPDYPLLKRKNRLVLASCYMECLLQKNRVLPLDHPQGEVAYYTDLRNRLRNATEENIVDWHLLTSEHSPDYLKDFLIVTIKRNSEDL